MDRIRLGTVVFLATAVIAMAFGYSGVVPEPRPAAWEDLVRLFKEWRDFQAPKIVDGVPDYSAAAMKRQHLGLKAFQDRLAGIDSRSWPVVQRADYEIIRAEMNGLDFDHRVLRPWSRNPNFYAVVTTSEPDVPAREGPEIVSVLDLWKAKFPLAAADIPAFQAKLKAIPGVLAQAKMNLTEDARDLWFLGIQVKTRESAALANLAKRLAEIHPSLVLDVERAKSAVDEFRAWLEAKLPSLNGPSGIGVDHFNWYMKNVHLVPYTWSEQKAIVEREYERSMAALALERHRNRNLPELTIPKTAEELRARYDEAVATFIKFMKDGPIFSVPDYMKLDPFRDRLLPANSPWDFFTQVEYRDMLPLRLHSFHWMEKQRLAREPHSSPIRSGPLLYNIWDSRSEGLATAWEELMMQAGLFDQRARGRELIYVLVAMRCARAMGDLLMHSGEFTLDQAARYAVDWTPYSWMRIDGDTVWTDMRIYLHQPGYGTSYVVGKVHIDKLMSDMVRMWGGTFTQKRFWDAFFATGVIPVSLIRWEMTGLDDEIKKLR